MLFGNKNEFAIEVGTLNSEMSTIALWLDGIKVGNNRELDYVCQLESKLLRIISLYDKFEYKITEGISLDILIEKEELFEKQIILNIGESFDDFCIRILIDREFIYFFWKLVEEPFWEYDEKMKNKIFLKKISKIYFEDTLNKFLNR